MSEQIAAVSFRCFHCDEVFTDPDAAAAHFGLSEFCTPACRLAERDGGLVALIRDQEEELRRFRAEETASYREFHALGAEHSRALREAEQAGYDRALADVEAGRVEPDHAARIVAALIRRDAEAERKLLELHFTGATDEAGRRIRPEK